MATLVPILSMVRPRPLQLVYLLSHSLIVCHGYGNTADFVGEIKPQLQSQIDSYAAYVAWQAKLQVPVIPGAIVSADDVESSDTTSDEAASPASALYRRLLDAVPDELVSVPLVLHCLMEQVDFAAELEHEVVTAAAHQRALQAAATEPEAPAADGADGAAPPAAPPVAAAVADSAAVDGPALVAALSPAALDAHVTRHWQLLAQSGQALQPSAAAASKDTVVVAAGDVVAARRSRAQYERVSFEFFHPGCL